VIVHQLLSGAGPVDAVTGQALAYRRLFADWGWGGEEYAGTIDPAMNGRMRPVRELRAGAEDLLLIHYSAYSPALRPVLDAPQRKLLVFHNVTPSRYFWEHEPVVAIHCAVGRDQLPRFVEAVDLAAAVSEFNARELRAVGATETAVIPILLDRSALGEPGPPDPPGPPTILFVGRLAPHKRHDEILRTFALYRSHRAPDARLALVGEPVSPAYAAAVERLAERLAPGAVSVERALSPGELAARYRAAHVFLVRSEHEGFCVPLLEAFHFGVPVIARPAGGIPEVAGDAALLADDDDPAVLAELLHLAVGDRGLRAELQARGRARLEAYSWERGARALRDAVERVAGGRA
jgi:glycosyltransferase involved in cell wall biosynthesis